jgi:hypothetical protein
MLHIAGNRRGNQPGVIVVTSSTPKRIEISCSTSFWCKFQKTSDLLTLKLFEALAKRFRVRQLFDSQSVSSLKIH